MKSHSSERYPFIAEARWKAFAGAQQQVIETLLKRPCPVVLILIVLGTTTAFMIFTLEVFQKPGRGNNEDSGFLKRYDTASLIFSLSCAYMEFTI